MAGDVRVSATEYKTMISIYRSLPAFQNSLPSSNISVLTALYLGWRLGNSSGIRILGCPLYILPLILTTDGDVKMGCRDALGSVTLCLALILYHHVTSP